MVSPSDHNVTILKSYGIEWAAPEDQAHFPGFTGTWLEPSFNHLGDALLHFANVVTTLTGEVDSQRFHGSLDRLRDMPEADDLPEDYVPDDDA
jgi:hypothetical protein